MKFITLAQLFLKKFTVLVFSRNGLYVLLVLLLVAGSFYFFTRKEETLPTMSPMVIDGQEIIEVSGTVVPSMSARIAFERNGLITKVYVKAGDVVKAGSILAELDKRESESALLQARANVKKAESDLANLLRGPRNEELAIKEELVFSQKRSTETVYEAIPSTLRTIDQTLLDVTTNTLAPLFRLSGGQYGISFIACDQAMQATLEKNRLDIEKNLLSFQRNTSSMSAISSPVTLEEALTSGYELTLSVSSLIDMAASLLTDSCTANNTAYDSYRTAVSSARTKTLALFSDVNLKRTSLTSAKNQLRQAELDLALTKAGVSKEQLESQQLVVASLKASLSGAETQYAKTSLLAPYDGAVSDVSIKQGEISVANATGMTLVSQSGYEVETKIRESDIAKVRLGNKTSITLDAYGKGLVFEGAVTSIDPSATKEGGVPLYKAKISFKEKNDVIKDGMTATLAIITKEISRALALPPSYIKINKEGAASAQVMLPDLSFEERVVILGVRTSKGLVEILSGLQVEDKVQQLPIEKTGAQKNNT